MKLVSRSVGASLTAQILAQIKGKFDTISFSSQCWIEKINPLKVVNKLSTYRKAYYRSSPGLSILKLKVHCLRTELAELPTYWAAASPSLPKVEARVLANDLFSFWLDNRVIMFLIICSKYTDNAEISYCLFGDGFRVKDTAISPTTQHALLQTDID